MPNTSAFAVDLDDTGLQVFDIAANEAFARRQLHTRDAALQMTGMRRLAEAFSAGSTVLLQALVNSAVDLCGADSAGISIQHPERPDEQFWEWVATAGVYSGFLNAILPRRPSACGVAIARGGPQMFRVNQRFFDLLGVEAPPITDGLLLPWQVEEMRGTIFVMAHGREEAFDPEDLRIMQMLADFAAIAVRDQRRQKQALEAATASAEAAVARELAHLINNPLQSLQNAVYLSGVQADNPKKKALARGMKQDVDRLSRLVKEALLPADSHKTH